MKIRIGKFYVNSDLIKGEMVQVQEVFSQLRFVPVRVEFMFYNKFEYIGHSHMFRETEEGEVVPEYLIIIHTSEDKSIKVSVEEIEK